MRRWTNKRGEGLRNSTAAGLVPLLLLASVPSCGGWSVDPVPTWPRVQGVKPGTKTEVQLYKDKAPQGRQKIKGRFLSATEDSVTLELTERVHTDLRTRTLQKSDVRKVLTHRPILKRWPLWVTLGVTSASTVWLHSLPPYKVPPYGYALSVGLPTLLALFGSRMGRIYEVPPEHRGLPQSPGPAAIKAEESNNSK